MNNDHAFLGLVLDEMRNVKKLKKFFTIHTQTRPPVYLKKTLYLNPFCKTLEIFVLLPLLNRTSLLGCTKLRK